MKTEIEFADLSFEMSFDRIEDIFEVHQTVNQIQQKVRWLREVSGTKYVHVESKRMENENGNKFTSLRLVARNNRKTYTLTFGKNDPQSEKGNPLGIFIRWDTPIFVYDWDTQETENILPEGADEDAQQGGHQQQHGRGRQQRGRSQQSSGGGGSRVAKLRNYAEEQPETKNIGQGAQDLIESHFSAHNRDGDYIQSALNALNADSLDDLVFGDVNTILDYAEDDTLLTFADPNDELPF